MANKAKRYPNGDEYTGDLTKDGMRQGKGTLKCVNGSVYEGDWLNDKLHGQGVVTFSSENRYEGEFKAGMRCGKGTYTWKSGAEYTGSWKNDTKHGHGRYKYADGTVFEGEFEMGIHAGKGVIQLNNGKQVMREGSSRGNTPMPQTPTSSSGRPSIVGSEVSSSGGNETARSSEKDDPEN
eukprot:TRINITY_DN67806_c2_g1_i1.p1 TRINITY_DN67806_c2_g1~~TRINITY_DN67806_c2_g1_i1.p1  ORF type:complete len:180 (+),score=29.11 TRINITY_DN67806_c2_g1_i1:331-870(+)